MINSLQKQFFQTHPAESPKESVGERVPDVVSHYWHHFQLFPDNVLSGVSVVTNVNKVVQVWRDALVRLKYPGFFWMSVSGLGKRLFEILQTAPLM